MYKGSQPLFAIFSRGRASSDQRALSPAPQRHPERGSIGHLFDQDFQNINGQNYSLESNFGYAQSLIDLAEFSLQKYINDGWELPPPDCDESIEDINS